MKPDSPLLKATWRALTSPSTLPKSARSRAMSSATSQPRQPFGPGGSTTLSTARISAVNALSVVELKDALIVSVCPIVGWIAYTAGESSGLTLMPCRHSGTSTQPVAFLRMFRASLVADAGSWLNWIASSWTSGRPRPCPGPFPSPSRRLSREAGRASPVM